MNAVSKAIRDISEALEQKNENFAEISADTISDLVSAIIAEPNRKKRKQLIKDFTARHKDAADFLAQNEDLINAEEVATEDEGG